MGGVAIWCMHFTGNRTVHLANGELEMQVAYSKGFAALSFFIPIFFLLSAFLAIGTNNAISWWRAIAGGVLCGVSICGMHYLGNTSIKNYTSVYQPAYVVGSAIIAVVASNVTLFMLFDFKATWTNSWRRRAISAAVLASAVSGMHWCAAAGTRYRFRDAELEGNELPKAATVIVAICLSLGACFVIAISTIIRIRNLRKSAFRAQQVTLGTTVFDKGGRILVDPDGLIPNGYDDNQSGPEIKKGRNARQQIFGGGLLMLLARHFESDQDAEWLMSAGYRFAELHQVSNIIRPGMQIQSTEFETKLRSTSAYANKHNEAPPGVHIGFFAIRASVRSGFDVLVQKDARNVLPSMALPLKTLDDWHLQLLKRFENMPVSKRLQSLNETSVRQSDQESEFAAQLSETIKTLFRVPCRDNEEWVQSTMIVMRLMIPIHSVLSSPNCAFVPLSFFKMRQAPAQFQHEFMQGVHQGFEHIVKLADSGEGSQSSGSGFSFKFWLFRRPNYSSAKIMNGNVIAMVSKRRPLFPNSAKSNSTTSLNPSGHINRIRPISLTEDLGTYQAHKDSRLARLSYGGVTSFQETTVNVEEGKQRSEQCAGSKSSGRLTIAATNPKTSPAIDIELQAMGHSKINEQSGLQISNKVRTCKGPVSYTSSFVDTLLVETIEHH
ncbi:hypothetical protein FOFC_17474 [Fusarium oxysporum]|nr:hypothetical protein FOFC_17474 [Fusarium oxysporum]